MLPSSTKTLLDTLKGCGKYLDTNLLSRYDNGRGKEKRLQWILTKDEYLPLKKMGVCVVENISRVFLSEWLYIHLWVMRVYIVWVKGREVTLKKPLGRMFRECLVRRPYPWDTRESDSLARLFSFQSCAPHVALSWLSFSRASREIHLIFK